MKKLYVVRGLGCWDDEVRVSSNFGVTMLIDHRDGDWCSAGFPRSEDFCYRGFRKLTGISLEPGEYTTIKIEEL